jgi:plasmid stabilization system protein ParE
MKLRFTPRALENLEVISAYLRSKNPATSGHVRAAIYASLQTLLLFPRIGRPQKAKGIRKLVTRKYAYLVYYTVDDDAGEVIILNIKHPARKREHSDS